MNWRTIYAHRLALIDRNTDVPDHSDGIAHRDLIPEAIHSTEQFENNRAEQSHEATGVRERGMRRFKSKGQAQRFVTAHAAVCNG